MRVQSTDQTKAHASSAEMTDGFPNFSLGIIEELDEHFLYDLDNEDENEFLAAVDLETVIATNQVDKGDGHFVCACAAERTIERKVAPFCSAVRSERYF